LNLDSIQKKIRSSELRLAANRNATLTMSARGVVESRTTKSCALKRANTTPPKLCQMIVFSTMKHPLVFECSERHCR
jgi:hypothetical protein